MSKEAQRGLTAIRGLFAKAAMGGGGPPTDDDELEAALEDDFEELDGAAEDDEEEEGVGPVEAAGGEYDEDEEEEPMPDEAGMSMVGKAADLDGDDASDVDAGPILADIAKAWQDTLAEVRAIREQNSLIAKGLMGLVDEQETVAKSVAGVKRDVDQSARLPKSGRGRPARRESQPQQFDAGAIIAKAVTDTEHFSSRDVAKLDSMLNRGDVAGIQREFDPVQVQALGLSVKN